MLLALLGLVLTVIACAVCGYAAVRLFLAGTRDLGFPSDFEEVCMLATVWAGAAFLAAAAAWFGWLASVALTRPY